MPLMINFSNYLLRINQTKNILEYSTSGGRTWLLRYNGGSCGTFSQLSVDGTKLLATTSKGLYYSTNSGRTWLRR